MDFEALEEEFAAKAPAEAASGAKAASGRKAQPPRKSLLGMQRAQVVGVLLAKLKMAPAQVRARAEVHPQHPVLVAAAAAAAERGYCTARTMFYVQAPCGCDGSFCRGAAMPERCHACWPSCRSRTR